MMFVKCQVRFKVRSSRPPLATSDIKLMFKMKKSQVIKFVWALLSDATITNSEIHNSHLLAQFLSRRPKSTRLGYVFLIMS